MGLFDRIRQQTATEITLGPAEAFASIVLIAIAADGYVSEEEINLLHTSLGRMHLFRSYSSDVMRRMFDKLCGILKRDGFEKLFDAAIAVLPHDLYETVFVIATDLVLADGQVTEEEEGILSSLCRALSLSDEMVQQIITVMLIKNRG